MSLASEQRPTVANCFLRASLSNWNCRWKYEIHFYWFDFFWCHFLRAIRDFCRKSFSMPISYIISPNSLRASCLILQSFICFYLDFAQGKRCRFCFILLYVSIISSSFYWHHIIQDHKTNICFWILHFIQVYKGKKSTAFIFTFFQNITGKVKGVMC